MGGATINLLIDDYIWHMFGRLTSDMLWLSQRCEGENWPAIWDVYFDSLTKLWNSLISASEDSEMDIFNQHPKEDPDPD